VATEAAQQLKQVLGGKHAATASIVQRAIEHARGMRPAQAASQEPAAQSGPLPSVRASGRPKSDALAGIAFGGNFAGHTGRKANRRQRNEALAKVAAAMLTRKSQPIAAPAKQAPQAAKQPAKKGKAKGKK
jgi:hypothetical protein